LKIIFAGTPDFSVSALQALLASSHQIIAVYTQPDRPFGRGRKLKASPVKACALEHGIDIFQPENLKTADVQQQLSDLQADVMVVVAYGLLLPEAVLNAPRLGCLNIHASLLPRWRGAAPIQRAILDGDSKSGVTIMQMDKGLDTGDMLYKKECGILQTDTAEDLHDRLAAIGAEAIVEVIDHLEDGSIQPEPQDESQSTYATKLDKAEAKIDWMQSAQQINRQVHAFNPWPVAQTVWGEKVLRVWLSEYQPVESNAASGTVIAESKQGIDVATTDGVLRILKIQLPGGKPMPVAAFLNAHSLLGQQLG